MAKKAAKRQFDVSRAQIDERLQGVSLATFTRRAFAYLIDWGIILLLIRHLWLLVLVGVAFSLFRKVSIPFLQDSFSQIRRRLLVVEWKVHKLEVDPRVFNSFRQYAKWYIYAFLLLLVVSSLAVGVEILFGKLIPEDYKVMMAGIRAETISEPFQGMYDGFKLFSKAVGGVFYFALLNYFWQGRTVGKRLMGIRAVKLNAGRFRLWDSIERVTGYTASASLLFTGFFQYFWDKNHQTTHDKICETIVVREGTLPSDFLQSLRKKAKTKKQVTI